MHRTRSVVAVTSALAVAAVLATPSTAADPKRYAKLSGSQEVPRKGDPNGSARVTLRFSGGRICYDIRPRSIETPVAGHIHSGGKGTAGPVVVALFGSAREPVGGKITGCARDVPTAIRRTILSRPSGFYVNLHTETYPDGSVRGQLAKKKPA